MRLTVSKSTTAAKTTNQHKIGVLEKDTWLTTKDASYCVFQTKTEPNKKLTGKLPQQEQLCWYHKQPNKIKWIQ